MTEKLEDRSETPAADGAPEDRTETPAEDAGKRKPTKAERLEARAARLREEEQRRAETTTPAGTRWHVATAVLAATVAALVVVLVIGAVSWSDQRNALHRRQTLATARSQALAAAKSFAVDFGSYDYQHLDSDFASVAAKMTPDFAKSYRASSSGLKATFVQYKTRVRARIQGYGLTSASLTKAVVVIFLDQTVRTSQRSAPRLDRNRIEIHLVRQHGKWLVQQLLAK